MMKTKHIVLSTLLGIVQMLSTFTHAQNVTVSAQIDSLQLLIGEQAKLKVEVTMNTGQTAVMPQWTDTLIKGIEVLDTSRPDTIFLNDNKRILVSQEYTITSFDSALYYIPPITVMVDKVPYKSSELVLKVLSIPVDTSHPERIFGPKPIRRIPIVWEDIKFILLAILVIIISSLGGIYFLIRLSDNKPIIRRIKIEPKVPPHILALREIERIKSDNLGRKEDPKEYYVVLTDIIRHYISDRFDFNALEMTSDEIIMHLTDAKHRDELKELIALLQTADLVKFAKYRPLLNENDANLLHAIDFVNDTKEVADENTPPEPTEITVIEQRPLWTKILLITGIVLLGALIVGAWIYSGIQIYYLF